MSANIIPCIFITDLVLIIINIMLTSNVINHILTTATACV